MKNLHFSVIGIYLDFDGVKKKIAHGKRKKASAEKRCASSKRDLYIKFYITIS